MFILKNIIMDGTREYKIVINGVEESINAVEALKKRLDELDAKIKTLESRSINVNGNMDENTVSLLLFSIKESESPSVSLAIFGVTQPYKNNKNVFI